MKIQAIEGLKIQINCIHFLRNKFNQLCENLCGKMCALETYDHAINDSPFRLFLFSSMQFIVYKIITQVLAHLPYLSLTN